MEGGMEILKEGEYGSSTSYTCMKIEQKKSVEISLSREDGGD
jgi:hypothetical protein